ncbi:hypothetical protein H5410_044772 [Solanum commersonii]|uniref:Uncharacterized protein n=1 Tax=Solanum commersonii TaxID=4109 RepID=A0A9J5X927_SOLCO|nr:hypothetical protein H5410_044772 [Solanum commersonii]
MHRTKERTNFEELTDSKSNHDKATRGRTSRLIDQYNKIECISERVHIQITINTYSDTCDPGFQLILMYKIPNKSPHKMEAGSTETNQLKLRKLDQQHIEHYRKHNYRRNT